MDEKTISEAFEIWLNEVFPNRLKYTIYTEQQMMQAFRAGLFWNEHLKSQSLVTSEEKRSYE